MNKDVSLIQRLMAKEPRAQRELIERFNSRLFMYFRLRIKGEEGYEDLVQEVFVSFFVAIQKEKVLEDAFIAPFIFGIARRVMYNFFYKKKRDDNIQKKGEEQFQLSYDFEGEERLQNEKLNEALKSLIAKLSEVDRFIIKEFYLKGNNIGEIAEAIGKTKHYVSVRKERALKKVKREISVRKDL